MIPSSGAGGRRLLPRASTVIRYARTMVISPRPAACVGCRRCCWCRCRCLGRGGFDYRVPDRSKSNDGSHRKGACKEDGFSKADPDDRHVSQRQSCLGPPVSMGRHPAPFHSVQDAICSPGIFRTGAPPWLCNPAPRPVRASRRSHSGACIPVMVFRRSPSRLHRDRRGADRDLARACGRSIPAVTS